MLIKDRIVEFTRVPSSQLRPNPKNWRTHPEGQKNGLKTILAEIGIADAVIARQLDDGTYELVDGHLRTETLGDADIPTLVVDLTEEEADTVLATLDPLASMAGSDLPALNNLLANLTQTDNEQLNVLFEDISDTYDLGLLELNEQDTDADYAEHDWEDGEQRGSLQNASDQKAVVLHLSIDEYDEFYEKAFELGDKWNLDNLADVVMKTVVEAYNKENE